MKLILILVLVAVVGWAVRKKTTAPKTSAAKTSAGGWSGGGSNGDSDTGRHNDGSVVPPSNGTNVT